MELLRAFNSSLVSLVIRSHFDQDTATLDRLNISGDIAQRIAKLPSNIRHRLESQQTPFIEVTVNESALNSAINSCYASGKRDEMYDKAILLGAAKSTMKKLCNMSSSDFASRRKLLGMTELRVRPQSLSVDEELHLSSQYREIDDTTDGLSTLIALAENSGIEINRIYTYFMEGIMETVR